MCLAQIGFFYLRVAFDVFGRVFDKGHALSQNGDPFGKREDHMHIMFNNGDGDVALVFDLLK